MVVGAQGPDVTADSSSFTDQLTVTSLVYQPLLPNVPLMLGVMTGGVTSDDGSASYAPMSQPPRCGLATPRWSCVGQTWICAASIAALPAPSAIVAVTPGALSASAPSFGSPVVAGVMPAQAFAAG